MKEPLVFTRKASGLTHAMRWQDIFLIAVSAPAGSGILYYSVSTASTYPGASIGLSFLLGMFLFLPIIFLAANTSGMIPRSGSLYVLISRVIDPTVGYIAAFLFYVGYSLAVGVVAHVVVSVFGGVIANAGTIGGYSGVEAIGAGMQQPAWQALIGILLLVVIWAVTLSGVHVFRNLMRALFAVTVLSAIATIVYFIVTSETSARALFDHTWGIGSFQRVLDLAAEYGWSFPTFSWSHTAAALLVVIWSFGGIELISYASGEVSRPGRQLYRGYMFAWITLGALYTIIAYSVFMPFGEFIGAYDFLYQNHSDVLQTVMPPVAPSIPFYVASIIPNPWVGVALALGISLWLVTTMLPYFFAPSRIIFALAMDRAIPEWLANYSERTGSPTWATHLTMLVACLGVLFSALQVQVVLGTILFGAFFVFWLYGLSSALLPYRRPELYRLSPVKASLFGVPVISWAGLLTFGIGWFILFFTVRQMTLDVSVFTAIILMLGLSVYFMQYRRNVKRGIDIGEIYSQIPPA